GLPSDQIEPISPPFASLTDSAHPWIGFSAVNASTASSLGVRSAAATCTNLERYPYGVHNRPGRIIAAESDDPRHAPVGRHRQARRGRRTCDRARAEAKSRRHDGDESLCHHSSLLPDGDYSHVRLTETASRA